LRFGETEEMGRDVIFEFYRVGNSVKVSAVDTETATEVSVVGPATASEATLKQNALRKLEFVLARRAGQDRKPR
jgi:hypothetical protein